MRLVAKEISGTRMVTGERRMSVAGERSSAGRKKKRNNIAWAIIVRAPTRRWKLLENLLKIVEAMLRCERKK